MRKFVLPFIFIIPLLTCASSLTHKPTKHTYIINKKKNVFYQFNTRRLMVSKNCGTDIKKMSCEAYRKGIKASLEGFSSQELKGMDPGSLMCMKQFKGKVVVGTNDYGENAFCKFKDHSLIDTGSLIYYAYKKK